jgi:hypothetical protein
MKSPITISDILRRFAGSLFADRPVERLPECEDGDPEASEPISPFEELAATCRDNGWQISDYRDLAEWPRDRRYNWRQWGWPPNKKRAQPYGSRPWEKTTTVMLHTTDTGPIGHRRGLGMPCHAFLPHDDHIVLCHSMTALVPHGHTGNSFSVGLEVSGKCAFDSPTQAERGRAFLRYFQAVRRSQVGEGAPCYVMSHRMSHRSRVRDPGAEIWEALGQWAIDELGYEPGPVVGSGRPNPDKGDKWH